VTGEFCPHSKIGASVNQKSHHGKATVVWLRGRMEYGRLPSNSISIDDRVAIHIGTAIQQQPGGFQISKFGGYVQKCRTAQREQACGGRAEAE
jgi:hypothetical protein